MSDHQERACTRCGSLLHHEDDGKCQKCMKKITVNVWGPKPSWMLGDYGLSSVLGKLVDQLVYNFRLVTPWAIQPAENQWAFAVEVDPKDHPNFELKHVTPTLNTHLLAAQNRSRAITVGWILGLMGVAYNTEIDFEVTDA